MSNWNKIKDFKTGLGYFVSGASGGAVSVVNPAAWAGITAGGNLVLDVATGNLPDFQNVTDVGLYVGGLGLDGLGATGAGQLAKGVAHIGLLGNAAKTYAIEQSLKAVGQYLTAKELTELAKLGYYPSTTYAAGIKLVSGNGLKSAGQLAKGVVNYSNVLNSASYAYKGSTVLGHALSKHAGWNPSIWGKISGHKSTWHDQALKHFDDIMNAPGGFNKTTTQQGINFLEKRLPDGRGIRLNIDRTFKGFID